MQGHLDAVVALGLALLIELDGAQEAADLGLDRGQPGEGLDGGHRVIRAGRRLCGLAGWVRDVVVATGGDGPVLVVGGRARGRDGVAVEVPALDPVGQVDVGAVTQIDGALIWPFDLLDAQGATGLQRDHVVGADEPVDGNGGPLVGDAVEQARDVRVPHLVVGRDAPAVQCVEDAGLAGRQLCGAAVGDEDPDVGVGGGELAAGQGHGVVGSVGEDAAAGHGDLAGVDLEGVDVTSRQLRRAVGGAAQALDLAAVGVEPAALHRDRVSRQPGAVAHRDRRQRRLAAILGIERVALGDSLEGEVRQGVAGLVLDGESLDRQHDLVGSSLAEDVELQ